MNQPNPLLNYRIVDDSSMEPFNEDITYNLKSGLWEDNNGTPLIKSFLENAQQIRVGETIQTATREGIDQTEVSSIPLSQTTITKTREGIDQSEISNFNSTQITETREAADQSERSI